jgi:homoserine dehydrogenase
MKPASELQESEKARMRKHEGGYYIRLLVKDHPGAFASIAKRMAEQEISLQSIVQKAQPLGRNEDAASLGGGEAFMPVVMITHETGEAAIRKALAGIVEDGHVASQAQMIRIEAM